MAYKFQIGEAVLSGSLTQKGDITAQSSDITAGEDLVVSGDSVMTGSLTVDGQLDLAIGGQATSIRGGLTVDEDALFSSDVFIDGTLNARSTAVFEQTVTFDSNIIADSITANYFAGDIREDVKLVANSDTLDYGYNYFATIGQAVSVNMPSSANIGDIVKIKAPSDCSGTNSVTISAQGSHTIDGESSIVLESAHAAIEFVYVAANTWKIF